MLHAGLRPHLKRPDVAHRAAGTRLAALVDEYDAHALRNRVYCKAPDRWRLRQCGIAVVLQRSEVELYREHARLVGRIIEAALSAALMVVW